MLNYFRDYRWREGKPVGIGKTKREESSSCYRLVSDPYRKWITIEHYLEGRFERLIYDSHLFDFRKLKPEEQIAWRKEILSEDEAYIFNEDDRLILHERYQEGDGSLLYSPHGILIGRYAFLKEAAQVVLYDSSSRPVTVQHFRTYEKGEFLDLLKVDSRPG